MALDNGPRPKVPKPALIVVVWLLEVLALVLVCAKIWIRLRLSRKLYADDYLAIAALVFLTGNAVILAIVLTPMYNMAMAFAGLQEPTAILADEAIFYTKCQHASSALIYTCLWLVKASFLAFFYRLVSKLLWPRRTWIGICVFTGVTYLASLGTFPQRCSSIDPEYCRTTQKVADALFVLRLSTAFDVITDLLIMSLPIYLTIGLQMPIKQKLGLIAVLALGLIIVAFALIRLIPTNTVSRGTEPTWLALWSTVEASVAVMVACLPSFKVLVCESGSRQSRGKYVDMESGTVAKGSKCGAVSRTLRSTGLKDADEVELDFMRGTAGPQEISIRQTFSVSSDPTPPRKVMMKDGH